MASIKIKFRSSFVESKEGILYYQIIHQRMIRQIKTEYKVHPDEWDDRTSKIILSSVDEHRMEYLQAIKEQLKSDINRLNRIIEALDSDNKPYITKDITTAFFNQSQKNTLYTFMQELIVRLERLGKIRTGETYATTLNSFMRFRKNKDVILDEIDTDLMIAYEAFLKQQNISMNTISFYMRILRAVYNRAAAERKLSIRLNPFKQVYTGIPKTTKRAIPLKMIKQIKELDLAFHPSLEYARDMFLFSFYTRGMSFIDMAYLRKEDLKNGLLTYRRKKTGQQLYIKWESCMQNLLNKYPPNSSPYLLPIIRKEGDDERRQYKNALLRINIHLKKIGEQSKLSMPLTMYVARHSWASIARSKNIPVSTISEGMGHDSEKTTRIYLASLDTTVVDRANRLVLKGL